MCSSVWDDFISKINVKIWSTLPGRNVGESNMVVVCHKLRHLTRPKGLLKSRLPMFCIDNYLQRDS